MHCQPTVGQDQDYSVRKARERGLANSWGYNTIGFFAPHNTYASASAPDAVSAVAEFKERVRTLHKAGVEVILDVGATTPERGTNLNFAVAVNRLRAAHPTIHRRRCFSGQPVKPDGTPMEPSDWTKGTYWH